ncbi:MAG: hypothetical protein ACHQ5A_09950 [Opitutales bacterium]
MNATSALLYLYATSLRNALVQRVRRLRQPKYFFGAVVGAAYFWFFVFRNMFQARGGPPAGALAGGLPGELGPLLVQLAAAALLLIVAMGWLLPNSRAALRFTEASVAFLFPAPVSRRTLIHAQLLRSQLGILFSAVLLTLIFGRGRSLGGNAFTHAVGWWLILSTLNLHFLGASFTRERLLSLGFNPLRRRLLVGGVLLAVAAACWQGLRHSVELPAVTDYESLATMRSYAEHTLGTTPLSWVLAPFAAVVRPYLAATGPDFLAALGPGLLLLVAHYFWVVRSDVAFEEASLELAAKRAAQISAFREGRWRARQLPTKPRSEPFRLAPTGWAPPAYFWKSLIALGPFFRLRTWVIACAVAVAGLSWLAADPGREPLLKVVGGFALGLGVWLFVLGPMFLRRGIGQTLRYLDITKAYPLAGWQVVLGELMTPMTLMIFSQWFLLLVAVFALGASTHNLVLTALLGTAGATGIALLTPPLCGLMLCIPYAGMLFFPAWAQTAGSQGGGVEVMGQRLIFMAGYLVVLVVAVLPAAAAGAVVFIIANWLLGQTAALIFTALIAAAVLAGELAAALWWLGDKLDRFDLSTELPR